MLDKRDNQLIIIVLIITAVLLGMFLTINNNKYYQSVSININSYATGIININTATKEEIETLPHIGDILSDRIIENRPYKSIEELINVKGIGIKIMTDIEGRVGL